MDPSVLQNCRFFFASDAVAKTLLLLPYIKYRPNVMTVERFWGSVLYMDSIWTPYGLYMDSIWTLYGLYMDYMYVYGL
jgi:hypothetical protein